MAHIVRACQQHVNPFVLTKVRSNILQLLTKGCRRIFRKTILTDNNIKKKSKYNGKAIIKGNKDFINWIIKEFIIRKDK